MTFDRSRLETSARFWAAADFRTRNGMNISGSFTAYAASVHHDEFLAYQLTYLDTWDRQARAAESAGQQAAGGLAENEHIEVIGVVRNGLPCNRCERPLRTGDRIVVIETTAGLCPLRHELCPDPAVDGASV